MTPSEHAYTDTKVSAGLFSGEIEPSTCCIATVKLPEERVVQLVGRSPSSMENGRSGCKTIPGFVLASYVIRLSLGRCNVSITI